MPMPQLVAQPMLLRPQIGHALVQVLQRLAATSHLLLTAVGRILRPRQIPLLETPAKPVPDPQQALQLLRKHGMALRPFGLPLQTTQAGGNLVDDVVDPQQVGPGLVQAIQGLHPLCLVQGDAGGFLKEGAAVLGPQAQDVIHQPLPDHRVGPPGQARLGQ